MTDTSGAAPTDAALLAAYAAGDGAAAQVLANRLLPGVLGQATRMLADQAEAEDVAQEAMIRLWKIAADWREGEAQISTWLYRVTANLCTDRLRKRQRSASRPLEDVAEPPDPTPGVEAQMQTTARHAALADALAQLPDRQAQAVALRHLEGRANPEIAQIMDISVRSVESLTARGKRALATILAGQRAALGYEND
ncbi:MAG: RNA polymerase sigma factor [Pseudomonadota bacterium]